MKNYTIGFINNGKADFIEVQAPDIERALYMARVKARAKFDNFNINITLIKEG